MNRLILFAITAILPFCAQSLRSRADEQIIIDSLLNRTTKFTVPVKNLTVVYTIELFQLLDIDEKQNLVTMRVWICINYTIPELAWDPADFDNVSLVYLPPGSVWTPDIELVDVSAIDYRGFKGQALWWDGTVTARSSMVTLKISCQLQFLNFPFDSQVLLKGSIIYR